MEVVFDCSETPIVYKTAGNLAIYAENSDAHVALFAKRMNYDVSSQFQLIKNPEFTGRKSQMNILGGVHTIGSVLKKFVDLTAALSKKKVKDFYAPLCESQKEKDELIALCSATK